MTQTWHADEETLQSWAEGSAPPLLAASVDGSTHAAWEDVA